MIELTPAEQQAYAVYKIKMQRLLAAVIYLTKEPPQTLREAVLVRAGVPMTQEDQGSMSRLFRSMNAPYFANRPSSEEVELCVRLQERRGRV